MSKGTIVLVPFPFTDLSGNKVRPCLVLAEQKKGEDCIVAFISSVQPNRLGTYELRLPATPLNGLKTESVVKMDKLATLQKKIMLGELGTVDRDTLNLVNAKLKKLFDLT